jgi:putative ABC transport system permease protein
VALPLSYSARNVVARPSRTIMTVSVIALVVVACSLLLSLVSSLKRTLISTGNPLNLVVLRKGSDNDGSSGLSLAAYQAVRYLDGIARGADGRPLISAELVVQPFVRTLDGGRDNVLVRGVEPVALLVHDDVRIVAGRMFRPSSGEVVIGRGVAGRYVGAELGAEMLFGRGRWRVVGIFESGGSSFESEVWADVRELGNDVKRPVPYSGFRLRASSRGDLQRVADRIAADPRYALAGQPETDYYAQQAESANSLYFLVVGIALLSGIGAGFGAANTMYASVQARVSEIGTLRALGFSRLSILAAFEIEAILLAAVGLGFGVALTMALAAAIRTFLGGIAFGAVTFTTNVIVLRVGTFDLIAAGLIAATVGIAGGLGPAWRAAHLTPMQALHKA